MPRIDKARSRDRYWRNLPKSAKNIIESPIMLVNALATTAVARVCHSPVDSAPRLEALFEFFSISRNDEQAIVGARPVQDHGDKDLASLENLEVEPLVVRRKVGQHRHDARPPPPRFETITNSGTATSAGERYTTIKINSTRKTVVTSVRSTLSCAESSMSPPIAVDPDTPMFKPSG